MGLIGGYWIHMGHFGPLESLWVQLEDIGSTWPIQGHIGYMGHFGPLKSLWVQLEDFGFTWDT